MGGVNLDAEEGERREHQRRRRISIISLALVLAAAGIAFWSFSNNVKPVAASVHFVRPWRAPMFQTRSA